MRTFSSLRKMRINIFSCVSSHKANKLIVFISVFLTQAANRRLFFNGFFNFSSLQPLPFIMYIFQEHDSLCSTPFKFRTWVLLYLSTTKGSSTPPRRWIEQNSFGRLQSWLPDQNQEILHIFERPLNRILENIQFSIVTTARLIFWLVYLTKLHKALYP